MILFWYTLVSSIICVELDPGAHMRCIQFFPNWVWQVPSAVTAGHHCSTCPSSRKDGVKCLHDTAGTPPITTEWLGKVPGMGRDSRTVPIDAPMTSDRRRMMHRDKTRRLPYGRTNPLELFQLKCASHHYAGDTNSTHFKRNNPLVYRVTARFNHGYTGSR
jgi:hypothetical protein